MDIKDIIKAKPELRDALVGAYVVELLGKLTMAGEDATYHGQDLNPHLSVKYYCESIVAAVYANIDEIIDVEFVMSVWLTELWLDSIKRQEGSDEVKVFYKSGL